MPERLKKRKSILVAYKNKIYVVRKILYKLNIKLVRRTPPGFSCLWCMFEQKKFIGFCWLSIIKFL